MIKKTCDYVIYSLQPVDSFTVLPIITNMIFFFRWWWWDAVPFCIFMWLHVLNGYFRDGKRYDWWWRDSTICLYLCDYVCNVLNGFLLWTVHSSICGAPVFIAENPTNQPWQPRFTAQVWVTHECSKVVSAFLAKLSLPAVINNQ